MIDQRSRDGRVVPRWLPASDLIRMDVDEAVRAGHEIPKSVETNPGQSHDHTRVPVAKRRVLEDYSPKVAM